MSSFRWILLLGLVPVHMWSQIGNIVVTDAAAFQSGIPINGSIGSIFCTGLNISGTIQAEGLPLPWSLAGISVTIGGASAPLFSVSELGGYQQINFQVPQEAVLVQGGDYLTVVTVAQQGKTGTLNAKAQCCSGSTSLSAGEFFTMPNSRYGAFQHAADFSAVTPTNPAHAGETIVGYMTGVGGATPVAPTGQASPFSPLAVVPQSTTGMSISEYSINVPTTGPGGGLAAIAFLGLAPGLVGVYQINFVLPLDVASGDSYIGLHYHWCNDACLFGGQGWRNSKVNVLLSVR
jgi:uncharacterized protein (TIGR03437 family)